MNRVVLALNVCLALFLVYRITSTESEAVASERADRAWTVLHVGESSRTYAGDEQQLHSLVLDLGVELAATTDLGASERVDLGLVLEPAFRIAQFVRGPREIELGFDGGLPRARTFTVHASRALIARDGRELPAGPIYTFATPPVRLERVLVDDRGEAEPTLLVQLDLPVDVDALRQRLRVHDALSSERVEVVLDEEFFGERQTFRLRAHAGWPDAALVVVDEGLLARGGDVGTKGSLRERVTVREPLYVTRAEFDRGDVELSFNRAIDLPAAADIELDPPIPFRVFKARSGLRLVGEFPPGEVLGVTLRAGFPGAGKSRIEAHVRRSLLAPDRASRLEFAQAGSVLSVLAKPLLDVRAVNVEGFRIKAQRVYPNNAVRMLQDGDREAMAPAVSRIVRLTAARNQESTAEIDLRELLGEAPRGLYRIELESVGDRWCRTHRLVQLTDLGVTLRAARASSAVQVVSIASGAPIAGAVVEIVSPTNQRLARAETDVDGTAMLRWPVDAGDDHSAYLAHVRTDTDEAFIGFGECAVELADAGLGGRPYADGRAAEAYVWPSRGIVRPGSTVDVAALVRDPAGRAIAGREVTISLVQPNGRAIRHDTVVTPGSGLVHASLSTSSDAPSGTWRVRIVDSDGETTLGESPIRVEAFVPYRLEAEVAAVEPLRFGDVAAIRVSGRWLDGTPAANRPVTLRVRLAAGEFAPAGFEEYRFVSGEDGPPPGELPSVTGVLDAAGVAELRLPLPADAAQQALIAHVFAEVSDPSGRVVRAAAHVPVLREDLHLGARFTSDGVVALCAVDAAGEAVSGRHEARVRLERRSYAWDYRQLGRSSRWRWTTRVDAVVVDEGSVVVEDGAASLAFELPEIQRGWLAAVATCGAVTTSVTLGEVGARPDRLRVEVVGGPVAPGQVAELAVDVPASGRGFVTLEGPEVLATEVVLLERGRNLIEVSIPADLRLPNIHAVVTLTRPARDVGPDQGPAWLVGGASIALERSDVVGTVTLSAPEQIQPGRELACRVVAPGATAAVLGVVDEGVLAITRHRSPDPVGHFLCRRRLDTRGADSFAALMQGARYAPGSKSGGDGGDLMGMLMSGSISPRIRPFARFVDVALDRSGAGVARVELPPDYEGRVRLMVLAAGPKRFAGGATEVVVSAPLGLQASAPRMVAPGDRFAIPVTLRNGSGAEGEVALALRGEGGLEPVEPGTLRVRLRDGELRSIDVPVRAVATTDAAAPALQLTATLGQNSREIAVTTQVRTLALRSEEHFGVRLGAEEEVRIPTTFRAAGLRATLRVDAAPDAQLRPALEALIEYPYGCVEQTTSRGFALLGCQALLPRIYGDETPFEARDFVQATVDRLVGMQASHGGFGWWPGIRGEYRFGTIYAMDFLSAAAEHGFRVPEAVLERGLRRVSHIGSRGENPVTRAFAAELESRRGQPSRGRIEWLAQTAGSSEERAVLAIALARLDDPAAARDLLETEPEIDVTREQGATLRSSLRTRALWFRARLAIDPADTRLPELAWSLQRELLRPQQRTTQELGQVLRALSEYYRGLSPSVPLTLSGTIDGAPLPPVVDGRIELGVHPGSVIAFDGGAGFALLTVRGLRELEATPSDGSFELVRTIVDVETGREVSRFRRGRVYEVRLHGVARRPVENVVIADLLPGGFEAETPPPDARQASESTDVHVERRDDRVLLFHPGTLSGEFSFSHLVRATFPGAYAAPPPVAEAMYDPGVRFTGMAGDGVEILP